MFGGSGFGMGAGGHGAAHLPVSSASSGISLGGGSGDLQDTPPHTPPNKNPALAGLMAGGAAMFNGYNGLSNGYAAAAAANAAIGAASHPHQDASKLLQAGLNSHAVNSAGSFKMM